MRAVAQRGRTLLLRVGGTDLAATGRIYDVDRDRLYRELSLATLEAAGYWGTVSLSDPERRAAVAAAQAALDEGRAVDDGSRA